MSFLDKLKVKVEEGGVMEAQTQEEKKDKKSSGFLQLDVDILQTTEAIIIIAPIPGVEVKGLDISVENENDVVTIQGKRQMPDSVELGGDEKKYLRQECHWGPFYRQIILPQEVNVSEVKAKFKKGILILRLPLLRLQNSGKKIIVINEDTNK
ncbi:Hsp20/alpha crystallin family protein [Candidatus Parcubacteria bacterium]|nr:Hsp20/alpha crystallin family protein [Candidatus Parcubacteria bacterium]